MPVLKLTKTNIDRVARPGSKADVLYWDRDTKGFGLRVTRTGLSKFIAQGRVRGTQKDVRVTIGSYGAWTVDEARRRADEYRHQFEEGIDPRDVAREKRAASVTLQQVLDAYVSRPGKLKANTAKEMRRHVARGLTTWAEMPVASITRDMVKDRHEEIATKGLRGKPAPISANATMVTLRTLLTFAMDEYRRPDGSPIISHNPVGALKRHWSKLGTRTDRYIDRSKVGAVWNALHEARRTARTRDTAAGVDLTIYLLLTGSRRDEAAALTWDRVHLSDEPSESRWHLVNRKCGGDILLPLSTQAVAILRDRLAAADALAEATGEEHSPYVFPSWSKAGRIMDARSAMELISKVAGKHLSLHDLRRSFTNYAMRECRIGKFEVDVATGHAPNSADVTARNYLDLTNLSWLYPEMQQVSDFIEQQGRVAAAQANGANVVALRR
jgi:integrase